MPAWHAELAWLPAELGGVAASRPLTSSSGGTQRCAIHRLPAWLDGRGFAAATILFVIGSAAAWYIWTHFALQRFPAAQGYRAPILTVALALATIAALMALALVRRGSAHAPQVAKRRAPRPWLVGVTAFLLGLVWLVLTSTASAWRPR